jgi:hypothetical protein
VVFETSSETVKYCPSCARAYRISRGLNKPDGWERKTEDRKSYDKVYRSLNKDKFASYEKKRKPRSAEYNRRKYETKMKRLHGEGYVVGNNKSATRTRVLTIEEAKLRHNSRRICHRAVRSGKILKSPCFVCGVAEVEAHHYDYNKPLDVTWLCKQHHREVHQ